MVKSMQELGVAFFGSCQDYVSIDFLKGLIRLVLLWVIYFLQKFNIF